MPGSLIFFIKLLEATFRICKVVSLKARAIAFGYLNTQLFF